MAGLNRAQVIDDVGPGLGRVTDQHGPITLRLAPGAAGAARRLHLWQRVLVYGLIGMLVEVMFSGVADLIAGRSDVRLQGYTYLWMHPVWATGFMISEVLTPRMRARGLHWIGRALLWTILFFAVEYAAGWTIRSLVGRAPWDYAAATANIDGLIRLDYAWWWACAGLIGERITSLVRRIQIRRSRVDNDSVPCRRPESSSSAESHPPKPAP